MSVNNDKTGVGAGRPNWRTPAWLVDRLDFLYRFTYDAAADHDNVIGAADLHHYSTVDGTFDMNGSKIDAYDGLKISWAGERVFINPPYSRSTREHPGIEDFVAKCASERNNAAIIVAVLPDSRDTTWWKQYVKPYARDFPIGRVKFIDPDTMQEGGSPPGGTALVMWLPDWLNDGRRP